MDLYLGKNLVHKTIVTEDIKHKIDASDEVLIMLFTNVDLKKLLTMICINLMLKVIFSLEWSEFTALSLLIILMRHPLVRVVYYAFVGYYVNQVAFVTLFTVIDFYTSHYIFKGNNYFYNTTWYYINIAYGTIKGIFLSSLLLIIYYFNGYTHYLNPFMQHICLGVLLHFIHVLNYHQKPHETDIMLFKSARESLYNNPIELEKTIVKYIQIIDINSAYLKKSHLVKEKPLNYISLDQLILYIRALCTLIQKAEFEDKQSHMSQFFTRALGCLLKSYHAISPCKIDKSTTIKWKYEQLSTPQKNVVIDDAKCRVIEGILNLFRAFFINLCNLRTI